MNEPQEQKVPIWGAILLVGAMFVLAFVFMAGVAGFNALVHHRAFRAAFEAVVLDAFNLGATQAAAVAVVVLAGRYVFARGAPWSALLALAPVPGRTVLVAVIGGVALQFPLAELTNAIARIYPIPEEVLAVQERLASPSNGREAMAAVFSFVLVAPLSEELLFRGLLMRGLARRHGFVLAWLVSALLFGTSHGFHPAVLAYATVGGLILGLVAWRNRSTWASVPLHAAVNAVPLLLPATIVHIPGFNATAERAAAHAPDHMPLPLLVISTLLAAVAIAWLVSNPSPARGDGRRDEL